METVLQSRTELLFLSGSRLCLSNRGVTGREWFYGVSVQLLCSRYAACVRRDLRKGSLRMDVPIWTVTGIDTQDPFPEIKAEKNIFIYKISGTCSICVRTSGHCD